MSIQSAPTNELVDAVRNWVHFENLSETLSKQAYNARTMKTKYETEVIRLLEVQNIKNAKIKITGATLQCVQRTKAGDLSWSFLEEHLQNYFKTKGKIDETKDILNFLQEHRGSKTIDYLKKDVR